MHEAQKQHWVVDQCDCINSNLWEVRHAARLLNWALSRGIFKFADTQTDRRTYFHFNMHKNMQKLSKKHTEKQQTQTLLISPFLKSSISSKITFWCVRKTNPDADLVWYRWPYMTFMASGLKAYVKNKSDARIGA